MRKQKYFAIVLSIMLGVVSSLFFPNSPSGITVPLAAIFWLLAFFYLDQT